MSDAKIKIIAEAVCTVLRRKGYFTSRDVYEIVKRHRWFKRKSLGSIANFISKHSFEISNHVEEEGLRYVRVYWDDDLDYVLSRHKEDIQHNLQEGEF